MHRITLPLTLVLAACAVDPPEPTTEVVAALGPPEATRTRLAGDLYHYRYVLPVGDGPNGELHLHRIVRERGGAPIRTRHAIVLMHGDFSTFATSFAPMLGAPAQAAPGLAPWLAARDVDVWGIDRRWTRAPRFQPDLTGFAEMGLDQELADIEAALGVVRRVRHRDGNGHRRVTLSGFSRGGQLAYFYASREALRPPGRRHIDGLVPLDVYASLDPSETALRQYYCDTAAAEYEALADGYDSVYNVYQLTIGLRALDFPDDPSPWDPTRTARAMMLELVGQTALFFPATPVYHLNGPTLDAAGVPTGLRSSSEDHVARWLAGAAPHQAMRESADTDAILCDPALFDVPLSRITVPVLSLAAAGGYGERANHSAAQVGSSDVTTLVVRQLPVEREAEDYGHADLLFAADAPAVAWQPLLNWLRAH